MIFIKSFLGVIKRYYEFIIFAIKNNNFKNNNNNYTNKGDI